MAFVQFSNVTKKYNSGGNEILALDNVEKMTSYTTRFMSDGVYYRDKSLSEFNIYGIDIGKLLKQQCFSFHYRL